MTRAARIDHVSDTATWVAWYRARESERPDAMFRDPLAKLLIGDRGEQIARQFGVTGRYTEWTVLARTVNIDDYILEGIRDGVDAVVNLGAGLDTRPYRLELPPTMRWVEADYPHVVAFKDAQLAGHTPRCHLQRVGADLADDTARRRFLTEVVPDATRVLVLTEGVVPYLTEAQVAGLAADLRAHPRFAFWLAEYFTPLAFPYLKAAARSRQLARAPFQFFPEDWDGFFRSNGWERQDVRFSATLVRRFGRRPPMQWWGRLLMPFISKERMKARATMSGFMRMARAQP